MPGPSFIHYNTTTNLVVGVFTTSRTPISGATEVSETHPIFLPSVDRTRWSRTAANTYVDLGPDDTIVVANPVQVSGDDTTPGGLISKFQEGTAIDLSVINPGGDEKLQVDIDINELTELASGVDGAADFLLIYDTSATSHKKVKPNTLTSGSGGGGWSFSGGAENVGGSTTDTDLNMGHHVTLGVTMYKPGTIKGFSIVLTSARTAGTLTVSLTINGVQQTGSGQTFLIDGTNTIKNYLVLGTPINVVAGDVVGIHTKAASFSPSGADAIGAIYGADT